MIVDECLCIHWNASINKGVEVKILTVLPSTNANTMIYNGNKRNEILKAYFKTTTHHMLSVKRKKIVLPWNVTLRATDLDLIVDVEENQEKSLKAQLSSWHELTHRTTKSRKLWTETIRIPIVFFHICSDQSEASICCHILSLHRGDCAVIFDSHRG